MFGDASVSSQFLQSEVNDMTLHKVIAASAFAALVGLPASAVFAQSPGAMGDSGSMSSAPAQSAQIDDATLQKAAKAYVKVDQITHQSKQADSSAQADPAAMQSQKIAAVRNEGLDPQQYNQVIQMVQNDPQLQQKFVNYVNKNGGETTD